ncbi:MAG: hypothetical protein IKQ17_01525 [Kiritimatiellae bacterium]|nr:hypothetical protein [Kiritimatiellia bacterium]
MSIRVDSKVVSAAMALVSCAAYADYTVTTNEGAVVFVNSSSERATVTDSYLASDGIDSLSFNSTNSGGFDFMPTQPSTYTGGTTIVEGQLYIYSDGALGPGPVTINDGSSLIVRGCDIVFDDKVIFGESYIAGFGGGCPTLRSVGSIGTEKSIRIGRNGAGTASKAVLSLTGGDSEALGRIYTSGALDLTLDGGTVAVRSDASSPFFKSATAADTPSATIAAAGVTFDVASGADVELGLSPVCRTIVTNVVATVSIPNGDFESGLNGWTIDNSANSQLSGVQTNGSAFDTSGDDQWTTTNVTQYLMLRVNQKISRTITVPSDGLWRVVFDQGCRPGSDTYSLNMDTVVKVGDAGTTTFKGPAAKADLYGFKRFETGVMELFAGTSYRLEVSIEQKTSNKNKSMNFDVFRMEKVEIADVVGRFTKTGGGTLRTDAWTGADVQVGAGILNIESAAISNTVISVQGGTLELVDARMKEGTQIGVSAGGALAFSPIGRENLISNGSFEVDGPQTNNVAMKPTGWTVGQTKTTNNNKNGSGLQGNGGNVTPSGPSTAARTVTVYLREYSTLSQTVSVTDAGKYRLSFTKACRARFYSFSIPVTVTVDGVIVFESTNNSTSEFERFSADVYLDAADHTITFTTGAPSTSVEGSMVFIDDVRLNPFKSQTEIDAGTIDMASGATLRLDNIEKVVIKDFRVDGMPIRGGRAAAGAAGVAVSGSGTVRFGDKPGLTVFLR